jgi:hypothetical protein
MDPAKIRLSPKEQELVVDAGLILTKNAIMRKAWLLLEQLQEAQRSLLLQYATLLPAEAIKTSAKISRGENYMGLPYLILDQPRHFNREHVLSIRTMFWWGHFFSTTLHLSGQFKDQYGVYLPDAFGILGSRDYFICINDDEWEHHFGFDNYREISSMSRDIFIQHACGRSFTKIAKKIPLEQWDSAPELLLGQFHFLLQLLTGELEGLKFNV